MGGLLRILVRFLTIFVSFLAGVFAVFTVSRILTHSIPEMGLFRSTVLPYLLPTILVSQVVATVITMSRSFRRNVSRVGMIILLFVLNAGLAFVGTSTAPEVSQMAAVPRLPEDAWLRGQSLHLFVPDRQGLSVNGPVFARFGEQPHLSQVERALIDPQTSTLIITDTGEQVALSPLLDHVYGSLKAPPGVASIASDARELADLLVSRWNPEPSGETPQPVSFFLRLVWPLAWALVVVSMWTLVRATRWPMFNVFLSVLAARGLLLLPSVVMHPTVRGRLSQLLPTSVSDLVIPAVWTTIGVFLLILAILMPPVQSSPDTSIPTKAKR